MDVLSNLVENIYLENDDDDVKDIWFWQTYLAECCNPRRILWTTMVITSKSGIIKSKINGISNKKNYYYDYHFNNILIKQSIQMN